MAKKVVAQKEGGSKVAPTRAPGTKKRHTRCRHRAKQSAGKPLTKQQVMQLLAWESRGQARTHPKTEIFSSRALSWICVLISVEEMPAATVNSVFVRRCRQIGQSQRDKLALAKQSSQRNAKSWKRTGTAQARSRSACRSSASPCRSCFLAAVPRPRRKSILLFHAAGRRTNNQEEDLG